MDSRGLFTRRKLLIGAAAGAAAVAWPGCRRDDAASELASLAVDAPDPEYDLCVIGSGFAAVPVALRAAAAGWRTLVVEAGHVPGADPGDRDRVFGFASGGEIDYPLQASRVIAAGGTSNHWSGTVNRLRESDFAVRARFGQGADWPLDYTELDPHYCRAERALAVEGFAPEPGAEPPRACAYPGERAGPYRPPRLELDGRPVRYFGLARSRRDGEPVRLARRELRRFAAAPKGHLLLGHPVTRLVSRDGRRIDHALARAPGGGARELRARVFVLAAGVVESARLLLLSRPPAFPDGIGNGRDLVGRHLVLHPTRRFGLPRDAALAEALFGRDPHGEPNRSYDWHDAFREQGLLASHFQLRLDRRELVLKHQPEMDPRPENRVVLSATRRNAYGDPIPELRLALSARDRATREQGEKTLEAQVRALGHDPGAAARSWKWRWHPAGTVRMGRDPASGVVDRDLRVFGLENLFVSGACVFPTSGTANPTLSVVALADRLADHLIGERAPA